MAAYPNNRLRELEGPRTGPRAWGGQRLRRRRYLDRIRGRERRNLLPVLHWPSRRRGESADDCLATAPISFASSGADADRGHEAIDRRDPYVFYNDVERRWWMLIAARLDYGNEWRRGCIVLAMSENPLDLDVEPDPFYVPGTAYWPERPEMWMAGGRWYLVFSRFSEAVGTIDRVANSPRGVFRVPVDDALGGRRWYAAKVSAPTETCVLWLGARLPRGRWESQAPRGADGVPPCEPRWS